jgi:hypothetical protein
MSEANEDRTDSESTERTDQIERRGLLKTVAVAVAAGAGATAGSSPSAGTPSADIDTTLTVDNVGASAWEVTNVDGGQARAPTGENNPTIELETNARFRIENNGWSVHPLAFRSASNEVLLSQDGSGTFESDPAVDWQDNGSTVAFTLTSDLCTTSMSVSATSKEESARRWVCRSTSTPRTTRTPRSGRTMSR